MKKYLMMALAVVAFASCSKSDDVSDANRSEQGDKYAAAFMNEFGVSKIASSVNWGFDKPYVANFDNEGNFAGFTRSAFTNKNQYADIYDNIQLDPLENGDEIEVVSNWFATHKSPATVNVNWSDFFVWQVSSTDAGKSHMDQLWCGATKESMEHVNNFNAGNCEDGTWVGHAMVMVNSGTLQWAYQESLTDGDHTVYDHFVCIPGYVIDPDNPNVRDNYYVGMDYEATGTDPNQHVDRDYLYNDWIVRINPGEYKNAERVFVEDLIATKLEDVESSDWDFNDVVFDVAFEKSYWPEKKVEAIITLRAAGGILPLTVAGKDVHATMLQPQNVMINTEAGKYGKAADGVAPAIFRLTISDNPDATFTANDIKVFVNGSTELKAVQGEATQKLCAPAQYDWCKEKVNIKTVYTGFVPYVKGERDTWY